MAGIPLSSGFNVSAGIPLDLRTTVATIVDRDNIPTIGRYKGLLVFVESDSKYYYLKTGITNSDWVELSGFTSHTHTKADITDFSHAHTKSDITDFAHTHTKSDITDFSHTHSISDVSGLQTALGNKVNTSDVVTTATANKILKLDANAKLPASITGNADGNAATATKLQTARTISLSGDVTGSANFDGSFNTSITATLANSGVAAGTYPKVTVDSKGRVTSGSSLSASDIPSLDMAKITTGYLDTTRLVEPNYVTGSTPITARPLFDVLRADRTAFLPASQIIIEKSTDAGNTWEDAVISDSMKKQLFAGQRPNISIPLKNGVKNTDCMIRITITGMVYNVPSGTPETEKYNYWNSNYVLYTERYFAAAEAWVWLNSNSDRIYCKVEKATGANPNNWILDREAFMRGWSGGNYILLSGTFGGSISQTSNYWNWRFTFRTCTTSNDFDNAKLSTTYTSTPQFIHHIKVGGQNVWVYPNSYMRHDHMYSWDENKNVTFPAGVTATSFNGNATTASKLQTARTITLSGDVSGSASFDGSANAAISTALSNTGVAAGTYTKLTVDSKGRATAGTNLSASDLPTHNHTKSQITDFAHAHIISDVTNLQTTLNSKVNTSDVVTTATANKILKLDANAKLPADITGNAATATKLATARTITLTGGVTGNATFDGSANITINTAITPYSSASHTISANTIKYIRIATSSSGVGRIAGQFNVIYAVSGYHGFVSFMVTNLYNNPDTIQIISLAQSHYHYNCPGILEARIVYKPGVYSNEYSYIELFVRNYNTTESMNVLVHGIDLQGLTLTVADGSVPTGYTTEWLSLRTPYPFLSTGEMKRIISPESGVLTIDFRYIGRKNVITTISSNTTISILRIPLNFEGVLEINVTSNSTIYFGTTTNEFGNNLTVRKLGDTNYNLSTSRIYLLEYKNIGNDLFVKLFSYYK